MNKPIVLIAEELSPATVDALGSDFDIRHVNGANRSELLASLPEARAVLIRSATRMDAEAFLVAKRLKVVARAGVGLDNVDIKAATEAGVMVVNAPTSNIVSAAELAVGHLLSLARHIPRAHASLSAGDWKRSSFTGVELFEKTIGIVGLGRIGALVAERLSGFGATLIGFDPYIQPARASHMGVTLTTLDDLVERSDFITIHIPKTPETTGMIGLEQLKKAKASLRIVNASRGGIIDEEALFQALSENWIAGVSVARSVKLALEGELVPDAVNVAGGVIDPSVRPGIPLMEKLGQIFAGLCDASISSIEIEVSGEIVEHDVSVLKLAALKGIFSRIVSDQVSYVNAPLLAEARGVDVSMVTNSQSDEYRNLLTIRGTLGDGRSVSASATLTGAKHNEKIVGINGYDVEVPLATHHVVMIYEDRPGIVAVYGKAFGEASINIAGMQIARENAGGQALSVLTVDSRVPDELLADVASQINATTMAPIDIIEL
jgi:D-3-phosphoglycerate dehydrogenase